MVTGAYYVAVTYAERFPAIRGTHEAWRYTLLSGMIPAIPLILTRPFLPESPIWLEKNSKGALKRPSFAELFRPALRKTTLVTASWWCSYALASGVIQQARMVPDLPEVRSLALVWSSKPLAERKCFRRSARLLAACCLRSLWSGSRRRGASCASSRFPD